MKRVLITGMSGTGKSTLIRELADRGFKAVDTDDDWPSWVVEGKGSDGVPEWLWREDLIQALLDVEDADVLFVSGCSRNQGKFYGRFDHVILLSAPVEVLVERLRTRTDNDFGKHPGELEQVLRDLEAFEPLLRSGASLEIDTRAPVSEVVETVLRQVGINSDSRPGASPPDGDAGWPL